MKDDELMVIGAINEEAIEGYIAISDVKMVFYDLIQVGPMFEPFAKILYE